MKALNGRIPQKIRKPLNRVAKSVNDDPLVASTKAFFRPFDSSKGVASPLIDGRPCQKFMAKAQTQVTLTSGQGMAFMYAANCASNSTAASMVFAVGAFTGGVFTTDGAWKNLTVGNQVGPFGIINRLSTSTPYTAAVLATGFEFASVGAGVKFTYEGSELYRGGTMRYIVDKSSGYNLNIDWTIQTVNGLIGYVNSSPNTIRQSINKDNVVEMNVSHAPKGYANCESTLEVAYTDSSNTAVIGGTTGDTFIAVDPTMLGYYVNTSGNTISFHVDIVEHWCVAHPTIQSLQTESYASAPLDVHVEAVMDNTRQLHASTPNVHHATVASTFMKAAKSPIGHMVLNAAIKAALA